MKNQKAQLLVTALVIAVVCGLIGFAIGLRVDSGDKPSNSTSHSGVNSGQQGSGAHGNDEHITEGEVVTVQGTYGCLPPKDPSLVQDMSCALGLLTDDGNYGLHAEDPSLLMSVATSDNVEVSGVVAPFDSNSSRSAIGTLHVRTITKI